MLGRKEWRVVWGPLCWPHRACTTGLPFLESKVKTQGNWLPYTLCIFTASTLWMALPSWLTGSYLGNAQNKVRAAVNASSLSPPRKESWFCPGLKDSTWDFHLLLEEGRKWLWVIWIYKPSARWLGPRTLYLGDTGVIHDLWDNCDRTDGVTCPLFQWKHSVGHPSKTQHLRVFYQLLIKGPVPLDSA